MNPVEAFIRRYAPDIPPAEVMEVLRRARPRKLARGDFFCQAGQTEHEIGILHRGVLQVSIEGADDRKATLDFLFPGMLAVAYASALMNEPSSVNIVAVTACELSVWPYRMKEELLRRDPAWLRVVLRLTEEAFVRQTQRARALLIEDAAKRYEAALRTHPPELSRVPQYLLASYLGIQPQSLSRIRRQITVKARSS